MPSKVTKRAPRTPDPARDDDAMERFIAENRDAIDDRLQQARASLAAGKGAPLESLPELLRAARRYAKARRR
ncbi:MAG TPA: hypothetical protein VIM38_09195 [Alphaproteobacteria bacterium]